MPRNRARRSFAQRAHGLVKWQPMGIDPTTQLCTSSRMHFGSEQCASERYKPYIGRCNMQITCFSTPLQTRCKYMPTSDCHLLPPNEYKEKSKEMENFARCSRSNALSGHSTQMHVPDTPPHKPLPLTRSSERMHIEMPFGASATRSNGVLERIELVAYRPVSSPLLLLDCGNS